MPGDRNQEVDRAQSIGHFPLVPVVKHQRVRAPEQGILESIPVSKGQVIQKGQRLATLESWKLLAQLRKSELNLKSAQAESTRLARRVSWSKKQWQREQELCRMAAGSQIESERRRQEYLDYLHRAEQVNRQIQQVQLEQKDILKEIEEKKIHHRGGAMRVKKVLVQQGDFVNAGETLFELESLSPQYLTIVHAECPESNTAPTMWASAPDKYRIVQSWRTQTGDRCVLMESDSLRETAFQKLAEQDQAGTVENQR